MTELSTARRRWIVAVAALALLAAGPLFTTATQAAAADPVRDAYSLIAASSFNTSNGGLCLVNGDDLGCADGGDWARYTQVNFGSATAVSMEITLGVTAANAGQLVEVRTGSSTGTVIGSFQTTSTNGAFATISVPIQPTTGSKTIVLRFPGSAPTGPVDNFRFKTAAAARTVSPDFFGMTIEQPFLQAWPTVPFNTVRAWGTYPDVVWKALNPSAGVYNWTNLDNYVNNALAHGQQIIYVFGHVPTWTSSNPTGDCDVDPAGTCYPPNLNDWTAFVTAITDRYEGKIKYWELWNEPDAANFWTGTPAQLKTLTSAAYPIIKGNGGTVLSPSPQGKNGPAWMSSYLAAGGAPYADINAFHSYLYDAPEALGALVTQYRNLFSTYSIGTRPLWDTEHSWGEPDSPFGGDQDSQAAWLARFQLLSFSEGIDRSVWYGWEHTGWGTLFDKSTQTITKAGTAYGQVHNWMVNGSMSPCTTSGVVYQCKIARTGGYVGIAAWASTGTSSFTVPAGYVKYRTIAGQTVTVTPGTTITLGAKPFLFEK